MASYAEYFSQNRYHGKYQIGDRVSGKYNGIPFIGTVGNDSVVNEEQGPRISIHLDLPMKTPDNIFRVIFVKHKDIKPLKEY